MCKYVCTCACYHICMCTYVRTCRITYMYIFVTIFATILLQTYLDRIKWSDNWVCVNIRKGCKAKFHYEVDLDVAGPGHDGMTDGIINVAATDYDDEYCVIDEMDIAVRNARNNVLREAIAGKFNTVFLYKKVVFLICIIFRCGPKRCICKCDESHSAG